MKKVIVPGVREEAEFECDRCGDAAYGQFEIHFWYGSKNDMRQGTAHLCDLCADKTIAALKAININLELKDISEL